MKSIEINCIFNIEDNWETGQIFNRKKYLEISDIHGTIIRIDILNHILTDRMKQIIKKIEE